MNNKPRIMIVASGGGHTTYGLAVAQQLKGKVYLIAVIPEGDSLTEKRLQPYVDKFYYTPKGKPGEHLLKRLLKILLSLPASLKLPNVDVVIATGSNHSFFPALIAKLRGAKLVVVEAIDRIKTRSKTSYLLSKISDLIALHWPEQKRLYPEGEVFGPILPEYRENIKNDERDFILVTFGSMGFEEFFDRITELLKDKKVVLQTGRVDPKRYKNVSKKWKVFSFDPNLSAYLNRASIVITHQGVTAAEAALVFKKPTIIIYNYKLKNTSGYEDTRILAKLLRAVFIGNYTEFELEAIDEAVKMHKAKRSFGTDGVKRLVEKILLLSNKGDFITKE